LVTTFVRCRHFDFLKIQAYDEGMSDTVINPIYWSAQRIMSYGPDTIHELALKAAGTLNSYHVVLGRCLLAVHRSRLFEKFGCSGAVHYGTLVLGLSARKARTLRRVAQKLEALPLLSRAGELGEVSWSKLREVVRKASAETERFWLELCRLKTYRQIERLVQCTPKGAIPGDLTSEDEQEPAISELRLRLSLTAGAIVDRGLQLFSLQQGRPVPLSEAVEMLFSQLLRKGEVNGSAPQDLEDLAKSQKEARKDLLAAALGRQPLVREARELAQAMGMIDNGAVQDVAPVMPIEEMYSELMEACRQAELEDAQAGRSTCGSLPITRADSECPARAGDLTDAGHGSKLPAWAGLSAEEEWARVVEVHRIACPGNEDLSVLAKDWRNGRLRFNAKARTATPAQRKELLRRDGYCCSTPGCSNHLWLELHHVVFWSWNGGTLSANLVTLCSRCHKNLHSGHLSISGQAPDKLIFKDGQGNDLQRLHQLEVAGWLDYWIGWSGQPEDSHQHRWAQEEWTSWDCLADPNSPRQGQRPSEHAAAI
jgi:hypothetical protein